MNSTQLNPTTHTLYAAATDGRDERVPPDVRARVAALVERRNTCAENDISDIDRQIVSELAWYCVQPDEVARQFMRQRGWRSPLNVDQAAQVVLAIARCGYPITGNTAPDDTHAAAHHWARLASQPITYVSLGDSRGYLPRPVQYDNPGGMDPMQQASLTLGPLSGRGDGYDSVGYMRRHTRRLILVRAEGGAP